MTYTELYPKLIQCSSLVPMDIPLMQLPYPKWYNENAWCNYHSGNRGYSTEDYTALKRRVHDLIKARVLTFEDEDIPNVNGNLLSDHQRPKINAVDNDPKLQIEKNVKAVWMPMETVYEALLKASMLDEEQGKKKEMENR